MKTTLRFCLVLCLIPMASFLFAVDAVTTRQIAEDAEARAARIEAAAESGVLFNVLLDMNPMDAALPATPSVRSQISFTFDVLRFMRGAAGSEAETLRIVTVHTLRSDTIGNTVYYFDDAGNLFLVSDTPPVSPAPSNPLRANRYYFLEGRLAAVAEDYYRSNRFSGTPTAAQIARAAELTALVEQFRRAFVQTVVFLKLL